MRRDMLSSEYPTAREEEEEKQEEGLEGNPTPLWRLFREASCEGGVCRDIAERHVISKLNQTDIKFFYDANSETRALIKRAARSGITLAEKFRVCEMFSISTLEFAWENVQWNTRNKYTVMNQPWFCGRVARTNKLELLKWAREEKKCDWNARTIKLAADIGNMEMLKYCVANECPVDEYACAWAASNGHLECLKYLHEVAKAPWDWQTASYAARNGHLHILEYLVERKYDEYDEDACRSAAENGHLDCLKYLHEVAKAPWDWGTAVYAAENGHLHILEYLVERKYDEYDEDACYGAAENGHLDCLKYLHEVAKADWDEDTANAAAENGHLDILEYLVERKYDEYDEFACRYAAKNGNLDCLKYLHEVAKAPWSYRAVEAAYENDHLECLQYLLENNCPLPIGWRD